jgi:hypothetical protein
MERYFLTVGGMRCASMDDHHLCFWPLEEVEPLGDGWHAAETSKGYFAFADCLIRSHAYAIRLDDGHPNTALSTAGPELEVVASSFEEFLRQYLQDPEALGA